jgi:hypothetical protein
MLGWVTASITGSRLLLRVGYRALATAGMASLTVGALLMSRIGAHATHGNLLFNLALMGIGMGLSVPALTIAVQTAVARRDLGTATSTLQFARSIGGAVGVSVMGAVLSLQLDRSLRAAGLDPTGISLSRLLDPLACSSATATLDTTVRGALAGAIADVFVFAFAAAAVGLLATATAPGGRIEHLADPHKSAGAQTRWE